MPAGILGGGEEPGGDGMVTPEILVLVLASALAIAAVAFNASMPSRTRVALSSWPRRRSSCWRCGEAAGCDHAGPIRPWRPKVATGGGCD